MKTITLQIGNSDNKLTQQEWSQFFLFVENAVTKYATEKHFTGCSENWKPWQNACFVFEVNDECESLINELVNLRTHFKQDSVAFSIHKKTLFI